MEVEVDFGGSRGEAMRKQYRAPDMVTKSSVGSNVKEWLPSKLNPERGMSNMLLLMEKGSQHDFTQSVSGSSQCLVVISGMVDLFIVSPQPINVE
jgi:hypothetical protein